MKYLLSFFILASIFSCVEPINTSYTKLAPGIWRGVFIIDQAPMPATKDEVSTKVDRSGELPFNFEVKYTDDTTFHILIKNADEVIKVTDITYNRDKATAKDTIRIDFPIYDTYITAIFEDNIMEGYWHVPARGSYSIPFKAYHGQGHRFTTTKETPIMDISGKWDTKFGTGDDAYAAIGEFKQNGNHLTGTFMTETGDYRYLDGTIQGDKLYLSTFDGSHAFLFEGKVLEDKSITGLFRSGKHYTSPWEAVKNDNAKLSDAFTLTRAVDPNKPLDFTFLDLDGNEVSINDEAYKNKVKLLKISGTWCPNCKDEILFLKEYFTKNPTNDVVVFDVNFEKYDDVQRSLDLLKRYKKKMDIPFSVLYGGKPNKQEIAKKLPNMTAIKSYPTLLFVDRNNKIRKIHTGFAGPATSEYAQFKTNFNTIINELISEK